MNRTIFFVTLMLLASLSIWKIAQAQDLDGLLHRGEEPVEIVIQDGGVNESGIVEAKELVVVNGKGELK